MMGLEKIDDGEIRLDNESYIRPASNGRKPNIVDSAIQREVGMVFQHYTLFPHLNIINNLILAPVKSRNMPRNEAIKRARALLEKFGP